MPRFLDRYLVESEWEAFLNEVRQSHENNEEPDSAALQGAFQLSQRTTKRTIRRAEKVLGIECSVPPELSRRRKRRPSTQDLIDNHLTPLQRLASSIDWRYMTVLEKAKQILPGRIGESRLGYSLDGRPCKISDIVIACNVVLESEGIEKLPC